MIAQHGKDLVEIGFSDHQRRRWTGIRDFTPVEAEGRLYDLLGWTGFGRLHHPIVGLTTIEGLCLSRRQAHGWGRLALQLNAESALSVFVPVETMGNPVCPNSGIMIASYGGIYSVGKQRNPHAR